MARVVLQLLRGGRRFVSYLQARHRISASLPEPLCQLPREVPSPAEAVLRTSLPGPQRKVSQHLKPIINAANVLKPDSFITRRLQPNSLGTSQHASIISTRLFSSQSSDARRDQMQKQVAWWLFGCSAWVFSMVVLGGFTRLTKSGLSMTDWKFIGRFPPTSPEEWGNEFKKYQLSPEYKRVNKDMSLEDFKMIYWIEYAHRMWGRGLGLFFTGPFAYFMYKGFFTRRLLIRLGSLLFLGAGQGFVGWWMVKSGLEEPESEYIQPRVSPYRLAGHLMSAFGIYSALVWTTLSTIRPEPHTNVNWIQGSYKLRRVAMPVAILVGLTAASGAFVAGNDAGHAFNTFPKMGDHWIPEDLFTLQPLWRNFFENTATVQFDHRMLATMTLIAIASLWLMARCVRLDPQVEKLLHATFGMSILQVTLGVSTLLTYVPVSLGVAHQAGALSLLTLMLAMLHSLRMPSPGAWRVLANKA